MALTFTAEELVERLASLAPPPRAHQVLYHGVLAGRSGWSTAEIEVYPANHGWCALDSPVYDEAQAEKAWARLLATYAAHL